MPKKNEQNPDWLGIRPTARPPARRPLPVGWILGGVAVVTLVVLGAVFVMFGVGKIGNGDDAKMPLVEARPDDGLPSPVEVAAGTIPKGDESIALPDGDVDSAVDDPPFELGDPELQAEMERALEPVGSDEPDVPLPEMTAIETTLLTARTLMDRRQMSVADRTLEQAARLAGRPEEFARLARLRMLHRWLTDFWAAFDRNRGKTPAGYRVRDGDTLYTIDSFTAEELIVTHDGEQHRYTIDDVPAPLAAALATRRFYKDDPYGALCVAAFWAIDGHGDVRRSADLLDAVRVAGLPYDALAAEIAAEQHAEHH